MSSESILKIKCVDDKLDSKNCQTKCLKASLFLGCEMKPRSYNIPRCKRMVMKSMVGIGLEKAISTMAYWTLGRWSSYLWSFLESKKENKFKKIDKKYENILTLRAVAFTDAVLANAMKITWTSASSFVAFIVCRTNSFGLGSFFFYSMLLR
jgi:hypothetical protein